MKLSSCLVEFHGSGCEQIENQILCKKTYECGLKVKQYEIEQDIDDGNSNSDEYEKFKKGNLIEVVDVVPEDRRLFAIADILRQDNHSMDPIGYPLKPIAIEDFKQLETKVNSIHDVVASVIPSDSSIIKETKKNDNNLMKGLIDLVNASKRIDALESGLQQLVIAMRDRNSENYRIGEMQKEIEEKIIKIENYETQRDIELKYIVNEEHDDDTTAEALEELENRLNQLTDVIDNIHCKCNESDYESLLFQRFYDRIETEFKVHYTAMHNQMDNLKEIFCKEYNQLDQKIMDDKKSILESLKKHEDDLMNCMKEIQAILDTKLNKCDTFELKGFIRNSLKNLEEKIENIDCNRALAAGITEKIFKNVTCISCGDKVIQIDDPKATKAQMLTRILTKETAEVDYQKLNLSHLKTRLCGGNHTITTPGERIFWSTGEEKSLKNKNVIS